MKGEEDIGMKYNAVFISDLHLGSKHCQSDKLLDFIKTVETNNLFLVGDIIDGWRLSKKWYWPKEHSNMAKEHESQMKQTYAKRIRLLGTTFRVCACEWFFPSV